MNGGGAAMGGIQASTDFFFQEIYGALHDNLQGGGDQYLNKSA